RLVDHRRIARAKADPVTLLNTLLAYRKNYDVPAISAALETALYASFANVQPVGRRVAVALDGAAPVASAIMAMLAVRPETSATLLPACVSREDRLEAVIAAVQSATPHLDSFPDVEALVAITGQSGS